MADAARVTAGMGGGIVDVEEIERKVNAFASIVGEEDFVLKVGGTLLARSAFYGQMNERQTVTAPIRENRTVSYQYWVSQGYNKRDGGPSGWFGGHHWVDTSYMATGYRQELVTVGHQARTQSSSASQYPGYIFSNGDLDINMDSTSYFGTIVSGGNVRIRGTEQRGINLSDRGTIIVRGNVNLELQRAALAQLALQAQNIFMNLVQDLTIRGIITPVLMPNGSISQLINLQRFGQQLGFLTDGSTFVDQGSSIINPTGFVPMGMPGAFTQATFGSQPTFGFSVYPTDSSGFMGSIPDSRFFMSTLQDSILEQLITLTLTPIYGRDILLSIDLAGELRRTGHAIADTFRGTQNLILPGGNPAILFDRSNNPDVEVDVEGQKMMLPLYNPFLLMDAVSRVMNTIQAEKLLHIKSLGDIRIEPGEINLRSEDLTLESEKQVRVAAEFKFNPSTGNRVGVTPVELSVPGDLTISGREGVETRGFQPSAKKIQLRSSEGSVVDLEMPLDPTYSFYDRGRTVVKDQRTFTSTFVGSDGMEFSAPTGRIDQHGTNMVAGDEGIVFDAPTYTWQPAYEESGFSHSNRRGFTSVQSRTPKLGGMQTSGSIIFRSPDTTLIGAQIIAGTISNSIDGRFRTLPAYATQESYSITSKSNSWGIGNSTLEIQQSRSTPVVTQIIADHFESLGVGKLELEGTVVRALDMTITKTLEERAAYERVHTVVTEKSSGFCAPKIKGDPFAEALRAVPSAVVTFSGDTLPTMFNVIGATAQTAHHAKLLANLGALNANPMEVIPQILLSRYMTGFTYSNIRTVTTINESRPVQSRIETGILRVTNDRTHLEGMWDITGRGEIQTGEFTTSAPRHTVDTHTETSGWSVSISPAALLGAYLAPGLLTGLSCLPNVSVQQVDETSFQASHVPMIVRADDLFIRCDNAVFSGTQIHARLMEAIVTGDLTIETLANEFRSESANSNFGICLGAIAGFVKDVPTQSTAPNPSVFQDPRISAIPSIRIADEERLSRKIGELAQMVGTERFYLTVGGLLYKKSAQVGLKPDGVVVRNDQERINAGRILEEQVQEIERHERHVFNPAISEFVGMMNQVNQLQEIRAKIAEQQMIEGVSKEERERTDKKVQLAAQQEEAKVSRVAEETTTINDQLNQKVKAKVGEGEIAKLTSGKPVSDATKAAVAAEVRGAVADLQAKRDAIAKTSSTSSIDHERGILTASQETQLGILNERIDMYQHLLFQLGRSSDPVAITRLKEGVGAISGIVGDTCRAADRLSYEQYVEHQISQMPEELRSSPEFCRDMAA